MKADFRSLANESVRGLTPYQPGKPIEELERDLGIKQAIKLASNENPLGASPRAILAIKSALENAHFYPDGGCFEVKHALANYLNVKPLQLTIGNGSENILELIVKAYLHEGDTAVISQYAFLTIPLLIQSYGVHAKIIPALNYGHDIVNMIKAVDEKTRVLFLVNPNNPTGTYTSEKDFRLLMESVPPHVLVVVDEAYYEYIAIPDYPNTLKALDEYPNLVITRTFSKAHGLAALRLGYSISSPEIADMLNRARLPFNVNTLAAKAACAALEDREHLEKSQSTNLLGMRQLEEELRKANLRFIPSLGNFVTIDVNDGLTIYQKLLYEGVIVRPLVPYALPHFIRVTIGTFQQNERFMRAIKKVR